MTNKVDILVVDNSEVRANTIATLLETAGYSTSITLDGLESLRLAQTLRPNVILVNSLMQGMNGFEICGALHSMEASKNTPVLLLINRTNLQEIEMVYQSGGVDFIGLPILPDELVSRIAPHSAINVMGEIRTREDDKLRAITNNIVEGLLLVNNKGIIELANPQAEFITGYKKQELEGSPFCMLLEEPASTEYKEYFNRDRNIHKSLSHGPSEVITTNKDQEECPLDITINSVFIGSPLYLCLLCDVSYRQHIKEEITQSANTDPLTNLHNRRSLDSNLTKTISFSQRGKYPIGVLMIDVDYFGNYNDNYSHKAGDEVLKVLAYSFTSCVKRPQDIMSRYSGEQFVIVLADTDEAGVRHVSTCLLALVNGLKIKHKYSAVEDHITVSIGAISAIPIQNTTCHDLVEASESALLQAKKEGRNQVIIHEWQSEGAIGSPQVLNMPNEQGLRPCS